jgi:hypothetical protein
MTRHLWLATLFICAVAVAAPKAKPNAEATAASDISAVKDKLTVWSDGKKHYVAMVMTSKSDSPIFWSSDGLSFYQLRVTGGASDGYDEDLKRLDRNFWEPRNGGSGEASLGYTKESNQVLVECATRKSPLTKLAADEAGKVVAAGKFYQSRWPRYAYALARDNTGKYYYIDNVREPEGAKNFRLWVGPKGNMKLQKMTNVVSDSQGDIFSTTHGELRLVLSKQDSTWIAREKPTKLLWVPVEDNHVMIYTDLGVYTGEPLGTPCDAL